ncbi:BLUF domain-containing protein [Yoonia sp.]|uniref:BLUF domain-containing protein n=1 Tax=Yoonia sp. TaxID=2212373 RepID=UPI0023B62D66
MKRVMYFSAARAGLGEKEVDAIVAEAAKRNALHGVTGALGFNGQAFCQVLEGDEDTLDRLLESISRDPRHNDFKIVDVKKVETRAFPDWTMTRVDSLDFQHIVDAMRN